MILTNEEKDVLLCCLKNEIEDNNDLISDLKDKDEIASWRKTNHIIKQIEAKI